MKKLVSFLIISFFFVFTLLPVFASVAWPEDQIPVFPDTTPHQTIWPKFVKEINPEYYPKTSDDGPEETYIYALGSNQDGETILSWYKVEMAKRGWKYCRYEAVLDQKVLVFAKKIDSLYGEAIINVHDQSTTDAGELFGRNGVGLSYYLWRTPQCGETEEPEIPVEPEPIIGEGCRAYHDIPPSDASCDDPAEKMTEREEIKARIKTKTGIEIVDSDLCDEENPPWDKEALLILEEALNKLPYCFLKEAQVGRISGLMSGDVGGFQGLINKAHQQGCQQTMEFKDGVACAIGGYLFLDNNITLCDEHWKINKDPISFLQGAIIHELTHAFQYLGAVPPTHSKLPGGAYTNPVMIGWLKETGWSPDGVCIPFLGCPGASLELPPDLPTEYARKTKDPKEDMAESVRLYVTDPSALLDISPKRYNFVKERIMCGTEY